MIKTRSGRNRSFGVEWLLRWADSLPPALPPLSIGAVAVIDFGRHQIRAAAEALALGAAQSRIEHNRAANLDARRDKRLGCHDRLLDQCSAADPTFIP